MESTEYSTRNNATKNNHTLVNSTQPHTDNDSCLDIELVELFPEHKVSVRTLFISVHSCIFVAALVGNIAIIYATARTKALQNIQNMLIVAYFCASITFLIMNHTVKN